MRALEPDHLVLLDSGLWVLDARQPVAAVIDPVSGELRRMVSWPGTVPPSSFDSEWVEVAGDGRSLWWQSVGGGLVCVDPDGVATAVRLRKPLLRTAYEGVAWAAPWPEQVLVDDADDPRVAAGPRPGWLVRIDRSGVKRRIETPGAVLAVHADERGTWVLAQTAQTWLHPLGVGYDLRRVPGWLRVPIHPPGRLTFAEHGVDAGPEVVRRGTYGDVSWFHPPGRRGWVEHSPVLAEGRRWYAGWPGEEDAEPPVEGVRFVTMLVPDDEPEPESRSWTWADPMVDGRMVARSLRICADDGDREVLTVELGQGAIRAIEPVPGGVAVSVRRPGPAGHERVQVVRVDGRSGAVRILLDDPPSIEGLGWPLVDRPADADERIAVARELSAGWADGTGRLPNADMEDTHAEVVGDWPEAAVRLEFRHPARVGYLLRTTVPVFDELGRPEGLEDHWDELWENLETAHLPSARYAVDGVLDIGPDWC